MAHKRRGHGRRPRPVDLPWERVEVDLTDAEKVCPCCQTARVRIGVAVSERLDYRPASLFVRQVVRPRYACRLCERAGEDPQIVQRPLPPEPIPRGTAAAGLAGIDISESQVRRLAHEVGAELIEQRDRKVIEHRRRQLPDRVAVGRRP